MALLAEPSWRPQDDVEAVQASQGEIPFAATQDRARLGMIQGVPGNRQRAPCALTVDGVA